MLWRGWLSLVVGLVCGPQALAQEPLLERVKSHYASVGAMHADFVQETRSTALGVISQRGTLRLERPNKMRWDFSDGRAFVGDGHTLWMYAEADKQVIRSEGSFQGSTSASLLQSLDRLDVFFEVEDVTSADATAAHVLALTPKEQGQFVQLSLHLNAQLDLVRVETKDVLGGTTVLTFLNLTHPQDILDEVFVFRVPDGVRVIDAGSWNP